MQPNFDSAEIERIVRLVVERLMRERGNVKRSPQPATAAHELRLNTRLVTVSSLEGQLSENITVLCVPTKAVVTPAVKDELKTRSVELRRMDPTDHGPSVRSPAVVNAAQQNISAAWQSADRNEKVGSLSHAVDRAIQLAKSDQMAVVLSEQPEVAVAAANRQSGIRAMVACGSHDWKSAVQSLGANLIVCHPGQWNETDVPRLLTTLWDLRGMAGPTWIK